MQKDFCVHIYLYLFNEKTIIMKPLSLMGLALAMAAIFLCTSFTGSKESALAGKHNAVEFATYYYWYYADDSYDDYMTMNSAILQLQSMYHTVINTNPIGGNFVAAGYTDNTYPHTTWPSVNLYSH